MSVDVGPCRNARTAEDGISSSTHASHDGQVAILHKIFLNMEGATPHLKEELRNIKKRRRAPHRCRLRLWYRWRWFTSLVRWLSIGLMLTSMRLYPASTTTVKV